LALTVLLLPIPSHGQIVHGDVDDSGAVNAVDVQKVILAVLGVAECFPCDVNGVDGTNSADVQLAVNAALGIDIAPALRPQHYTYEVINEFPHDRGAFTQGLVVDEGILYEGTGLVGRSSLRRVELETGAVEQQRDISSPHFAEGITTFADRIIQLTWVTNTAFVYDKTTLSLIGEFTYPTEGWGITHDGTHLFMSDGTSTLYTRDPGTFDVLRTVTVVDDQGPVNRLNELEYIDGEVYANVWLTDTIVRINPSTGLVVGRIDLSGLLSAEDRELRVDVLNGIAYDAAADRLLVTGKLWPKLFEIRLIPVASGG
jgi:glutamine cyclotransferase